MTYQVCSYASGTACNYKLIDYKTVIQYYVDILIDVMFRFTRIFVIGRGGGHRRDMWTDAWEAFFMYHFFLYTFHLFNMAVYVLEYIVCDPENSGNYIHTSMI